MPKSEEKVCDSKLETIVEFDEFGLVKNYVCPACHSKVKLDHEDDLGTKWFLCQGCGQQSSRLKSAKRQELDILMKEVTRPLTLDELSEILNSTIKHDKRNKLITFLSMLLTYTEEDQINLSFTAESSTGKSYIPLELAWYYPAPDVIEYSYVSPTAFFHEYGMLRSDPSDKRDVEEEKKRKIIVIDLRQKILIFIDQPHDMLLQRLRPLLSHDRKTLVAKITDRRARAGLRTKTVLIEGYPTVLFCTAKFSMEEQERTRLLLLSPETTRVKIKDAIKLRIERESDRQAFQKFMNSNPQRKWLQARVETISYAGIKYVIIPEELREKITKRFFEKHETLIPRHQRDIGRLLALVKAYALLNYGQRKRVEDAIIVNEEDVQVGFNLYEEISTANELGLSPEVYNIYVKLKEQIQDEGITRKELQTLYYKTFHRTIGKKRLKEILEILQSVGLIMEEPDPNDRRRSLFLLTCRGVFISNNDGEHVKSNGKINTPQGVSTQKNEGLLTPQRVFNSEPSICWICHKLLPEDLRNTTVHEGKTCHVECLLKLKAGRASQ